MKSLQRWSTFLLLLMGLIVGLSGVSAHEGSEVISVGETALPSCHYIDQEDGKPIKLVNTSAISSVPSSVNEQMGSSSGIWTAAIVSAIVGVVAVAFGYLVVWFNRFK